jgi:hypothetical protein
VAPTPPASSESAAFTDSPTDVTLPTPDLPPGFGTPEGLVTRPSVLIPNLGYGTPDCFVLTPVTCFDAGYKCYIMGLYEDALAFTHHGLRQSNNARLYLLQAVCEMHLGKCEAAGQSILRYRSASTIPAETIGLGPARERINDPMRVRLEFLLAALP